MSATAATARDPEVQRLLDRALDDQKSSWSRGERTPVEAYLARDPALCGDAEAILDLIYHEYVLRRDRGEDTDPNEFFARFPDHAESLMLQFGVDAAITPTTRFLNEQDRPGKKDYEPFETIAGYEVLGLLGRGGMGIVYKAREQKLGRIVAIKTIAEGRHATPDRLDRFQAEAHAIARLSHPNIIAIHAIGEHDNGPYLSLEFADGGSLARRLAEKPMAPREAAALVETLARAVHAAHHAGVVHRDLKPGNVLLTAVGVPKVSDFGLAKLLDSDSGHTMTGQPIGTPSFMAPEQAQGPSKQVGPPADTYALGAILYQALTGRPPFLGESAMETLRLVTSTEVVAPHLLRPDVPRDLETICLKCLEKEPHKRYASAEAIAEDLRRFLEDRPIAARPVGPVGRLWRWTRRNPRVAGLSAAVLVSLILGIGASTTQAFRAIRAEAEAREQRDVAKTEAANFKAVNEFLRTDLLAQAGAHNQARPGNRPDPDLKVRTALDRAAAKIGQRFASQPLNEASIRQTIGETYLLLGLLPQARLHLQRAVDLRRQLLGDKHPDTLLAMGSLGAVHRSDGKLAEAEPLLVGAMDGLRSARGPENTETLAAINAVAQLRCDQGRLPEAESLLIPLRETYRIARGADAPETLDATGSLAVVYMGQNRWELAERLFLEVLKAAPGTLGNEHPTTLAIKSNLAAVYQVRGNKAQAARLFEEAMEAQASILGRQHPDTLVSMASLGCLYADQQRLDKAEPLLTEALAGCRTALDRNHLATEAALAGLSNVYVLKRDMQGLGKVLLEAAEINRIRWGVDHATTSQADQTVGKFFVYLREYDKAEPCYRDCLTYWLKNNPGHQTRHLNELEYGMSLLAQKKYTEARAHFLIGFNGIRESQEHIPPLTDVDLGWLIEQVVRLRDADGHPITEMTMLASLHKDPTLQAIVLDLQFPANPFAGP